MITSMRMTLIQIRQTALAYTEVRLQSITAQFWTAIFDMWSKWPLFVIMKKSWANSRIIYVLKIEIKLFYDFIFFYHKPDMIARNRLFVEKEGNIIDYSHWWLNQLFLFFHENETNGAYDQISICLTNHDISKRLILNIYISMSI